MDVGIRVSCRREFADGFASNVRVELEDEHDDSTPVIKAGSNSRVGGHVEADDDEGDKQGQSSSLTSRSLIGKFPVIEASKDVESSPNKNVFEPTKTTASQTESTSESSKIALKHMESEECTAPAFDIASMELWDIALPGNVCRKSTSSSSSVTEEQLLGRRRSYDSMVEKVLRESVEAVFDLPKFDFQEVYEVVSIFSLRMFFEIIFSLDLYIFNAVFPASLSRVHPDAHPNPTSHKSFPPLFHSCCNL